MSGEWPSPPEVNSTRSTRGGKVRACAECRRLKLRCDRNFPCQACIRRGCSALCPDKCFTDEATPRSLKANNLKNREEIQQLHEKVAILEAALAASTSSDTNSTTFVAPGDDQKQEPEVGIEETVNTFGSLSVDDRGAAVFHGDTSWSENFMKTTADTLNQLSNVGEEPSLPSSLMLLSAVFPFAPRSVSNLTEFSELLEYLPSAQEALETSDIFWYTFSHGITPITRPFFISKIYNYFYPPAHIRRNFSRKDTHKLGLLYIYIALGYLADERQPMLSMEAEKYYQLARATLSLDRICDNPTLHGLQCMVALSWYLRCTPNRETSGYRWCLDGVTLKLASMMGIFRNCRNWIKDPDEVKQREALCWELVGQEVWQAFTVGRPCSIDVALIDCPKPPDDLDIYGGLHGFVRGAMGWKHRFYPVLYQVLRLIQQPRPVKYGDIVKLERELRQAPLPEKLVMKPFSVPYDGLPDDDEVVGVQRFACMLLRETICCLLHRRFLVMAMENGPQDPRKHPFWYSAYQAGCGASWIIKCHIAMYRRQPALVSRVPAFWSASFSAAIMLGAMAARYWNYDFAKGSLEKFESICALFKETAETALQPANALELLEKLQNRVRERFMHPEREFNLRELPLVGATPPAKQEQRSQSKPAPPLTIYADTSSDFSSSSTVATPDQYYSPTSTNMTTAMTTPVSQMNSLVMTGSAAQSPEYIGGMASPTSSVGVSPHMPTMNAWSAQPQSHAQPIFDWKMPVFNNLAMFPQSIDGFDPRQLWGNAQVYGGYGQDGTGSSPGNSPGAYEQAMLMDVQAYQTDPWDGFLNSTLTQR